jgi:hypothetical protein
MTVYYTLPQTIIQFPQGGFMLPDPSNPLRFYVVAPETDDATGITVRRKLWLVTIASAGASGGVASVTEVNTGFNNVHDIWPYLDGVKVAGEPWATEREAGFWVIEGSTITVTATGPLAT